jgi:Resolvase, N terminal domain
MQLPFASIPILPPEKEKNFFDLAQILGPLPKAWPGGAACSVDRSGEEDSQNRPFHETYGSASLRSRRTTSPSTGFPLDESQKVRLLTANVRQKEELMKIGYVRVSKQEQHEALQIDALKEAGCDKWFVDKMTGSKAERKGLDEALAYVRPGDTFIVWKLDRAGRSLTHLIELLRSSDIMTEQIDTTTPGGKLIFHLMGALAEFERDLIRERTNAGLAAARARGHVGGRPRKLKTNRDQCDRES